jgi:hypothetical protein
MTMSSIFPHVRRLFTGMLMALSGSAALAQSFTLSVESTSNLYAVGQTSLPLLGGGTLPPAVVLTPGTGRVLTFATVTGSVSYNDVDAPPTYLGQYNGPDGGAVNFQDASWPNNYLTTSSPQGLLPPSAANAPTTFYMDMASSGGVSGLLLYESNPAARRVMFLSGVFTSGSVPQAPAPAILNFSSSFGGSPLGTSFTQLSPLLNQSFYIGDGLTGTGSGTAQSFMVPDGATHFYLGIVDGGYFVGAPDYYDNNRGSFSVQGAVAVPEPASWAALVAAAGAAAVAGSNRRRR